MTYGFDNFYGEMDVNIDITKDYTIFAVVKIDFNVSVYRYMEFLIGGQQSFKTSYHFQKINSNVMLQIEFDGTIVAKTYKRKIEMCKFAYTSYEKILTVIKSFLRGLEFDDERFLDYIKVVDEIIIDMCPLFDKFEDKYNKLFTTE